MNLRYSEQRVQEAFERLSIFIGSEKDKADFFLTKAWESYWHRKEYSEWLRRIKKGEKNQGMI